MGELTEQSNQTSKFSQDAAKRLGELDDEDQRYWAGQIFAKLIAIYGEVGNRQYNVGDPVMMQNEWIEALLDYRIADIGYGLKTARGRKYPPTLPEFLALCDLSPARRVQQQQDKPPRPPRDAMNTLTTSLMEILAKPRRLDEDPHAWAKDIVSRWEAGDLNNYTVYATACAALRVDPRPKTRQGKLTGGATC